MEKIKNLFHFIAYKGQVKVIHVKAILFTGSGCSVQRSSVVEKPVIRNGAVDNELTPAVQAIQATRLFLFQLGTSSNIGPQAGSRPSSL